MLKKVYLNLKKDQSKKEESVVEAQKSLSDTQGVLSKAQKDAEAYPRRIRRAQDKINTNNRTRNSLKKETILLRKLVAEPPFNKLFEHVIKKAELETLLFLSLTNVDLLILLFFQTVADLS